MQYLTILLYYASSFARARAVHGKENSTYTLQADIIRTI